MGHKKHKLEYEPVIEDTDDVPIEFANLDRKLNRKNLRDFEPRATRARHTERCRRDLGAALRLRLRVKRSHR